jgi:hypothetical protein
MVWRTWRTGSSSSSPDGADFGMFAIAVDVFGVRCGMVLPVGVAQYVAMNARATEKTQGH